MIKLYGVPGWGSAISEVMLTWLISLINSSTWTGLTSPVRSVNCCTSSIRCAVPTLELENGAIMTETAAIALMVLDRCPDLAPPVGQAERQQFQRLLIWFVANVYPTFTYADYPERWVPDAPEQLQKNCIEYRKSLYLWFESQLKGAPFALGERLTLLDVYIAVARTRGPRHDWFAGNTPKFTAIADAVCQRPELHKVLKANNII